ncbi:hypothetical protein HII31_01803 [Pseudocercospora fuligena]|uniref:Rhodopsin domain-containing protein n=1 Tax=Pseudocercospora fuligena TaxID=685502 RepID=A0A8H6VM58_9PEZI|nr:hypothetical protein HII31_01803 [Pseudocercospora fuligena]
MTKVIFDDNAPNVAATIIILTSLSLVVYPMRVYTRVKGNAWGWDDWSMTFALIPYAALSVFCLGGSFLGIGVHKWKLTAAQNETGMMWFFFFECFYCLAIIPIKLSISFMLMRVAGPKKNYIYALWAMSTLFIVMNLISFFYIVFRCNPVSYAWNTNQPGGSCLPSTDLADIYYADTAVNIITDWFCALLPIPLLWDLKLNTNSKISVGFLLSLGVLASLSACIRLKYTVNLNSSDDYLFSVADVLIWGFAENGVGFIVGCISTLRPLFRKMFHLGDSTGGSGMKLSEGYGHSYGNSRGRLENGHGSGFMDPPPAYSGGNSKGKTKTAVTSSQLGRKTSADSGTESEEYILQDMTGVDMRSGIQVSRSVVQTRGD